MILMVYVSTAVFITQGNYIGYMFRLFNSHLQAYSLQVNSQDAVYLLLLLPRGNARIVVLSHTMTMSCRIREWTIWWGSLSVNLGTVRLYWKSELPRQGCLLTSGDQRWITNISLSFYRVIIKCVHIWQGKLTGVGLNCLVSLCLILAAGCSLQCGCAVFYYWLACVHNAFFPNLFFVYIFFKKLALLPEKRKQQFPTEIW